MSKHTPGPWQVRCNIQTGNTLYGIRRHTHTAIALDEAYWPSDRVPPVDSDNYCQPDEFADIEEHRIATARLIAAAPDLLEAAMIVYAELNARIDAAPDTAKPVFRGLAELHTAIAKATDL